MKNEHSLPTLLGLGAVVVGIVTFVLMVQLKQEVSVRASGDLTPKDVRLTNIDDGSFTVSWVTGRSSVGTVLWGQNTNPETVTVESSLTPRKTHLVKITGLTPSTKYFVKILGGETVFDNSGIPWEVSTSPTFDSLGEPYVVSGTILTSTGVPANNVLVYLSAGGLAPLTTITGPDGGWFIPLSTARASNLQKLAAITDSTSGEILAESPTFEFASAQISLTNANPLPTIKLGEAYNFKSLIPPTTDIPQSYFLLPDTIESSSQLNNLSD